MRVLFLLLIAAAAGPLPAQAPATQQPVPPPAFRAGTRVVEVNLIAVHTANKFALRDLVTPPINDLQATDLRVFDNGVEQTIASFEKSGASAARPVEPQPPRLSIIVLDCLNTFWVDQIYGRDGVTKMLTQEALNNPPSGDRIAIATLGEKFQLLHDVSTDYVSLRTAVQKYEGERPLNGYGGLIANLRNRILDTLEPMTQVAQAAKSYPGKKSLLWVADGIPTPREFQKEVSQAVRDLNAANMSLYVVIAAGLHMPNYDGSMDLAQQTGGRILSATTTFLSWSAKPWPTRPEVPRAEPMC